MNLHRTIRRRLLPVYLLGILPSTLSIASLQAAEQDERIDQEINEHTNLNVNEEENTQMPTNDTENNLQEVNENTTLNVNQNENAQVPTDNTENNPQRNIAPMELETLLSSSSSSDYTPSDKLLTLLSKLGFQPTDFADHQLAMMDKELHRNCWDRLRSRLLMNKWLERLSTCLCVKVGVPSQSPEVPDKQRQKIVGAMETELMVDTKRCVCPTHNRLPSYYYGDVRCAALFDNIDVATKEAFAYIWSPLLNLFLLNDIYNYFAFPAERGDATLWKILNNDVEDSVLRAFTENMAFWYTIIGLGSTYVLLKSCRLPCQIKDMRNLSRADLTQKELALYTKSKCCNDLCGMCVPSFCIPACCRPHSSEESIKNTLRYSRAFLLWDPRLSPDQRKGIVDGVVKIGETGGFFAKLKVKNMLTDVAHGTSLYDFVKLQQAGFSKKTLQSLLATKADALSFLYQ